MNSTPNGTLRSMALQSLQGKWGLAIGTMFLYGILVGTISFIPFIGFIGSILITGPFALGVAIFSLNISRNTNPKLENIFDGFKNFGNAFIAYFLMGLFVFLWALLLIIPGIIKALAYSQTFYIMVDEPNISPTDAMKKSETMMKGYKTKLFLMQLVFGLLSIACAFTLGIGLLWLIPFMQVTLAKFYEDVRGPLVNPDIL